MGSCMSSGHDQAAPSARLLAARAAVGPHVKGCKPGSEHPRPADGSELSGATISVGTESLRLLLSVADPKGGGGWSAYNSSGFVSDLSHASDTHTCHAAECGAVLVSDLERLAVPSTWYSYDAACGGGLAAASGTFAGSPCTMVVEAGAPEEVYTPALLSACRQGTLAHAHVQQIYSVLPLFTSHAPTDIPAGAHEVVRLDGAPAAAYDSARMLAPPPRLVQRGTRRTATCPDLAVAAGRRHCHATIATVTAARTAALSPAAPCSLAIMIHMVASSGASLGGAGRPDEGGTCAFARGSLPALCSPAHAQAHAAAPQPLTFTALESASHFTMADAMQRGDYACLGDTPGGPAAALPRVLALCETAQEVALGLAHLASHGIAHDQLTPACVVLTAALGGRGYIAKVGGAGRTRAAALTATTCLTMTLGAHAPASRQGVHVSQWRGVHMLPPELISTLSAADADAGAGDSPGADAPPSPEAEPPAPCGQAATVYRLGLLLYEAAAGRPAFSDLTPTAVAVGLSTGSLRVSCPPAMPHPLADVIHACTHPQPGARPGLLRVAALLEEAQQALAAASKRARHHAHRTRMLVGGGSNADSSDDSDDEGPRQQRSAWHALQPRRRQRQQHGGVLLGSLQLPTATQDNDWSCDDICAEQFGLRA